MSEFKSNASDKDVTPRCSGLSLRKVQFTAERVEDLPSEEANLAFVVLLVVKESVAADTATRNAVDPGHLQAPLRASRQPVMAKIIVCVRNIKASDLPCLTARDFVCIGLDCGSQKCVCGRLFSGADLDRTSLVPRLPRIRIKHRKSEPIRRRVVHRDEN